MNCDRCSENMSAYLDGELNSRASARMEAHLASCRSCSADLESLRDSAHFVDAHASELALAPDLWMKVHGQISNLNLHPVRPRWKELVFAPRWRLAGAAATAALAVAIGAGSFLMQRRQFEREASALMESYSRMRNIEEQWHFAQEEDPTILPPENYAGISRPEVNPFAVVKYGAEENPFRSEEQ